MNDDLLSQGTLCCHLDARFGFGITSNYVVDLINFFAPMEENASLILMTSDILMFCFDA